MAEYPFLYLLSTYLPDPSGTLTMNLKLHAYPIKSKKALQNVPLTSVLLKRNLKSAISLATICMADIR